MGEILVYSLETSFTHGYIVAKGHTMVVHRLAILALTDELWSETSGRNNRTFYHSYLLAL